MTTDHRIRCSILDLVPIPDGGRAAVSFQNMLDLAQHAEGWGYHRYWLAEHHNIPGVASAATSLLIGHVAQGTERIRVGAGGIMLPNHAPLVIAEQFGTLESLFPGRIDLGLGRAPGGDRATMYALRRGSGTTGEEFPADLQELRSYFQPNSPRQVVRAIPGEGLDIPIYLLGSSPFSARLAAELGLPLAFASHFAPDHLLTALSYYRSHFQPSAALDQPYVMVGINAFAADSDEQAARLFTSLQQQFVNLVRGRPQEVPPPVDSMEGRWSPAEQAHVERMTRYSAVGSPHMVRDRLTDFLAETQADELILTAQMYEHAPRLRSFEIAAKVVEEINADRQPASGRLPP